MVTPRTMPGVLELLPREQIRFQFMLDTIRSGFELFGFVPIETPAIELSELLLTKTGGETERQVYFVQSTGSLERGDAPELALRFDLTVPFARYVAEHEHQLVFPFRRYQIQRVYRGESAQRGRFREFYQCDIDVIGRDALSLRYDAEMPAVIVHVFTRLDIGAFTVRINNRKLMRGLLEQCGVAEPTRQAAALREIDKLARQGTDRVRASLGRLGIGEVDRLLDTVSLSRSGLTESFAALDAIELTNPLLDTGVSELRTVLQTMHDMEVGDETFALDLSIARGLDYYTGTVYETTMDDHPGIGSICSGGRYDDLAGQYTSSQLPGVGISIGLTRLFWQLREAGLVGEGESGLTAYVTLMDEEGVTSAFALAASLRRAGINTESAVTPDRLGKQLRHADRAGARFALIVGSDERSRGTVTIRDLREQTQLEVPVDGAAAHILESRTE